MERFARVVVVGGEVLALCWLLMLGADDFWTLVPMVAVMRVRHARRVARRDRAEAHSFDLR